MSDEPNQATQQVISQEPASEPKTHEEEKRERAVNAFSKKGDALSINVKIYSPSQVYFDGLAFSVTATNATGEFDILPKHHPFICLLNPCDMVVRSVKEGSRKISISGGLMHVKEDKIIVFLDI